MNNPKWTMFAIGYQCLFAYVTSFCIFQLGSLFGGSGNIVGAVTAFVILAAAIFLLFKPYEETTTFNKKSK